MRFTSASIAAVIVALLFTDQGVRASLSDLPSLSAVAVQRPFEHRRHERVVSCRECHGAGTDHRTMLVRTPRDCAACHHDERRALQCTTCHAGDALPQARPVATPIMTANAVVVRTRNLSFGHARHAGIECRDCHQTPITLQFTRGCSSCHENHHRPEADCTSCHPAATRASHDAAAHLSCAGAGCHERQALPERTRSRTLCLTCHVEQTMHEPAGSCAACHRIPARGRP